MGTVIEAKRVSVRGVVQGVGFRPFVYRLAHDHGLMGWVLNHSGGVDLEVEGPSEALDAFVRELETEAPPLARIERIEVTDVPPDGYRTFEIRHSVSEAGRYQLISPDVATCPDCLSELFDPADRRYRYPFTNCTNCGPRFTIIEDIPYDRPLTTMRSFAMCPVCQAEYDNPLNRRFHAQPNACPVCGPRVWLQLSSHPFTDQAVLPTVAETDDAIAQAAQFLRAGAILAIKGLGGFHLACDATDAEAVRRLRERKMRPGKPLAVMMAMLDEVRRHCQVSEEEEQLLTSSQCPIVLLPWRPESEIAPLVAPGNRYLGVMLPYTPLHHVLLRDVGRPLVMTSGNLSEEPIAGENDEALRRLSHLADAFLLHNRDISARYDDSVWFVPVVSRGGERREALPQPIRRSRGYAPYPIKLPFSARQILACGPELKNTFCLTRDEYAFVSQHIGDLENLETLEHYERTVKLFQHLFRVQPEAIAHDLHPDYMATRYAQAEAARQGLRLIPVQHDHAHVASCLADSGWPLEAGPVIGVAWDGTGYGLDERIWGGEFLVADYASARRVAHLESMPMPGGEAAIRNPYRLAVGYVYALTGRVPRLPLEANVGEEELRIIQSQIEQGINCPQTSAGGRLFDAVAALLGLRLRVSYDAQAAIELEMAATEAAEAMSLTPSCGGASGPGYALDIDHQASDDGKRMAVIRLRGVFEGILEEMRRGVATGEIALRFHITMAETICATCAQIAQETGLNAVALGGG
ncbi:MAG: carbamoyltransferase HypF, partial [Anaerolineales bacterium]|nr:carbamoyltransferase HypF [Anaerolineales bacterium]